MANRKRGLVDEKLLQSLACGSTVHQAAVAAGVSERTAYRRLEDADFIAKLNGMKSDFLDRATRMLSASSIESIRTLLSLQSQTVPERIRLGAAKAMLTLGIRIREEHDLSKRLEGVEQVLKFLKAEAEKRPDAQTQFPQFAASDGTGSGEAGELPSEDPGDDSGSSGGDLAHGGDDA
jgi:hypothetical protein